MQNQPSTKTTELQSALSKTRKQDKLPINHCTTMARYLTNLLQPSRYQSRTLSWCSAPQLPDPDAQSYSETSLHQEVELAPCNMFLPSRTSAASGKPRVNITSGPPPHTPSTGPYPPATRQMQMGTRVHTRARRE